MMSADGAAGHGHDGGKDQEDPDALIFCLGHEGLHDRMADIERQYS